MKEWAELIKQAPLVAMVLALGYFVFHLYKSKDKLQTKYTEDLVKATKSLQELTSQYLTQSFTDSAGWQEQVRTTEAKIVPPLTKMTEQMDALIVKVNDLHDWHNKDDGDGVKLWYVRRSQEETLNRLVGEVETLRAAIVERGGA